MRLLEVSDAFSFHSSLYFRMGVLRARRRVSDFSSSSFAIPALTSMRSRRCVSGISDK